MSRPTSMVWTTGLELEFIKDMGKHSECCKGRVSRADLLRGYLESLNYRKEWDNISRVAVMEFVLTELAEVL